MEKRISSEMIDKYLKGKCSAEEELALFDWYVSCEEEEDPLSFLSDRQRQELKDRMFQQIVQKLDMNTPEPALRRTARVRQLMYALTGVAAMFILVFSLFLQQRSTPPVTNARSSLSTITRVSNVSSTIRRHSFPDGSVAWLQPHTVISYNRQFSGDIREVSMTGEAFFYVEKNPKRPFVIHAEGINVKVLGTSFNVKSRGRAVNAEVSVLTGKVLVTENAPAGKRMKAVYLLPKHQAVYRPEKRVLEAGIVKDHRLDMWRENRLSFDNIPVEKIVERLNSTFNVKISVASKELNAYTLKADFSGANLPSILEMLGKSLNLTYKVEGDKIVLLKN